MKAIVVNEFGPADVMKYKIRTGCAPITGNRISTMLHSFFYLSKTLTCVQDQSIKGIMEVADHTYSQVTTSLQTTMLLSSIGVTLTTGAVRNISRLLLNKESPLAIEDGNNKDELTISTGGKRKSRRRGRKSKKTRKGKKGRESRRKH